MITALSFVAKELTSFQIEFRVEGSSPVEGSSKRRTFGAPIREIAIDNRRLIPPDS
jgi:hypothetical protein